MTDETPRCSRGIYYMKDTQCYCAMHAKDCDADDSCSDFEETNT